MFNNAVFTIKVITGILRAIGKRKADAGKWKAVVYLEITGNWKLKTVRNVRWNRKVGKNSKFLTQTG